MISIKTPAEISRMKECGEIMKNVFKVVSDNIQAGMTTKDVDGLIYDYIKSCGATAPCLGYYGYPSATCISLNEMVVHGIPSSEIVIKDGDIVSVDVVVGYNGYQTDAARTYKIGKVSEEKEKLVRVTEECFFKAIETLHDGSPIGDIGYAVQTHAESNGFSVVRAFTGHGIGKEMHEDPSVPNFGRKGTGIRLKSGMTICIEPMINAGNYRVDFMSDGWGAKTIDRRPSAHYENTVVITDEGVEILTL